MNEDMLKTLSDEEKRRRKHPYWIYESMQMEADITGISIEACRFVNQCPLGAAILAACGVDFFKDPGETLDFISHETKAYFPNEENMAAYEQRFEKYLRFRSAVVNLYE